MNPKFVLTIEQMQILIDKGLDCSNATFAYEYGCESNLSIKGEHGASSNDIPAFSLQDMLDIMPATIIVSDEEYMLNITKDGDSLWYEYIDVDNVHSVCCWCSTTSIQNAYNMLLWLIDSGHVKVDK